MKTGLKSIIFICCLLPQAMAFAQGEPTAFPFDSVKAITGRIKDITVPSRLINIIDYSKHSPGIDDTDKAYDFRNDIQKAIDELDKQGGGQLLFPHPEGAKTWNKGRVVYNIVGPIELCSNIELIFEPAVVLYFKFNPLAYSNNKKGVITRYEGTTIFGVSPLFHAIGKTNIIFSCADGSGAPPEIKGDGERWLRWQLAAHAQLQKKGLKTTTQILREINNQDLPLSQRKFGNIDSAYLRPAMFEFFLCKNIAMDGLMLTDGPFWMVHPVFSQNMIFRNLIFDASIINNDGIDIESSKDALIENIMFNNHDDNVAVKSGRDKEGRDGVLITGTLLEKIQSPYVKKNRLTGCSENVVIRNCVFKGNNALCIGSEMSGSVRNIYALNNIAPQNVEIGLFIKGSRKRGGMVENVFIKNFTFSNVKNTAIAINPNYDGDTVSIYMPTFKNIYIEDITVSKTLNGILIYGWSAMPTKNITLKNINIQLLPSAKDRSFSIANAQNVNLSNVIINDKKWEGTFNNKGSNKSIFQMK